LVGFHPFKVSYYLSCWNFDFTKRATDTSYFGYTTLSKIGHVYKKELNKIELFYRQGKWYCKLQNEDRKLQLEPYLPTHENEKRRKLIYYEAMLNYQDYVLYSNYGWMRFPLMQHKSVDTVLLNLPYDEYCKTINSQIALKNEEVRSINSFSSKDSFYLFEKVEKMSIERGQIISSQDFFYLLKQAIPIEEPASFIPKYSVQCNPFDKGQDKKRKWQLNNNDYFFSDRVFTIHGYWYQFDRNIIEDLKKLSKPIY